MVSLANRSRPFSSGLHRTYRIEMGGRTLLVSLGLALLTGLVVFYMGVVAGEGSRTPIVATVPVQSAASGDSAALPQADPDQLAFNRSLMKETPMVEDLWESQEQAAQQTRDILARAQRELTVEEVAMPTAAPAIRDAARPERANTPPAAQAPREAPAPPPARAAAAPPATDVDPRYTVQVFSSRNRESAAKLADRLKGMGFAAYLNQFQDTQRNTWYRVRVGKGSKADAERLQANLQRRAKLESPQIVQL